MTLAGLNGLPAVVDGAYMSTNPVSLSLQGLSASPAVASGQYIGASGDDEPLIPLVPTVDPDAALGDPTTRRTRPYTPKRDKPEAVDRWWQAKIPHRIVTPSEIDEAMAREVERDIAEITEYVAAVETEQREVQEDLEQIRLREREADLAAELAHLELLQAQQSAKLDELEQNRREATAAIKAAIRHAKLVAAAKIAIKYFYY